MARNRSNWWWLRRSTTVLSLACLFGCVLLGIRSFWRTDHLSCGGRSDGDVFILSARSTRGTLLFRLSRLPGVIVAPVAVPQEGVSVRLRSQPPGTTPRYPAALWRFALEPNDGGLKTPGLGWIDVHFPLWAAAALFAIPPMYIRLRRTRVQAENVCATCGYDLRATPDRCPECGAIVGDTR